jgi:hypothetical protein
LTGGQADSDFFLSERLVWDFRPILQSLTAENSAATFLIRQSAGTGRVKKRKRPERDKRNNC